MNIYQKLAFTAVAALGLGMLAQDKLTLLFGLAVAVALLVVPTTWRLIYLTLQMLGYLISGVGHGVGWIGDVVAGWSEDRKVSLPTRPKLSSEVPAWDSSELQVPAVTTSTASDLDVPDFLKDEKRDDAGLDILEPR